MPRRSLLLFAVASVLAVAPACGEDWTLRTGAAARHQLGLELTRPAVVLYVSPEPGAEDLALIAWLRFHAGARVTVVHVTNGETTPGDSLACFPAALAGERKSEAARAADLLGAATWFANMPAPGACDNASALAGRWPADTLMDRLVLALRTFKPDLVVLGHDWTARGAQSIRDSVTQQSLLAASVRAAGADTMPGNLPPWRVSRIVASLPGLSHPAELSAAHPLWRISSSAMGEAAAGVYRTLARTISRWQSSGHEFHQVQPASPHGNVLPLSRLLSGLPRIPERLSGFARAVRHAVSMDSRGVRSASLVPVSVAIDSAERVLIRDHASLSPLGLRVALAWKNGLEDLRCALLGIDAEIIPSDSLLTGSQVWFLRVRKFSPLPADGTTEVIFPLAMNHGWLVNETLEYHFPLKAPQEFRVLTPEIVPQALPLSSAGLRVHTLTFPFPFFIVHKSTRRETNFSYRGEVKLHMGPHRTFEILSPLVPALPGWPVIFQMQNFSRDPFKGSISLTDSNGRAASKKVAFTRKDEALADTLGLPYPAVPGPGTYLWTLELSGKGGKKVVNARSVSVTVDSSLTVGLSTFAAGSPLVLALKWMRQPWAAVNLHDRWNAGVLLIDRESMSADPESLRMISDLARWVEGGGHLIVLPQEDPGAALLDHAFGLTFEPVRPIPPDAPAFLQPSAFLDRPNLLGENDLKDWVVMRGGRGVVAPAHPRGYTPLLRSRDADLIGSRTFGKGRVTLVGADIWSQLINLNGGALRLLANVIAMR